MANMIDLSLFEKEPMIIKDLQGTEYRIPGEISTKFVLKFASYEQVAQKIKTPEDAIRKIEEMVADILNLDPDHDINVEYVQDRFKAFRTLQIIVHEFGKHLREIESDPNSSSPNSSSKTKATRGTTKKKATK